MRLIFRLLLLTLVALTGYTYWSRGNKPDSIPSETGKVCFTIEGYNGCGYFNRASSIGKKLHNLGERFMVTVKGHPRQDFINSRLPELNKIRGAGNHRTSPFVYRGCGQDKEYVGGAVDFLQEIENKHQDSWQKIAD